MTPEWLPDLVATDGEWNTVIAGLYAILCRDFRDGRPRLNGLPVKWDDRVSAEGFEEAFWHLVMAGERSVGERLFEPERARYLSWCGAVIENAGAAAVLQWVYREKREPPDLPLVERPGLRCRLDGCAASLAAILLSDHRVSLER
jgi:hypothetical protein